MRARRPPRVAMTVEVTFVAQTSATARMSAIWASRPCRIPAPTTRRRSSLDKLSARISAIASQPPAAKCARNRSATWLAAFSSRGACGCNSSNRASAASRSVSSNSSQRSTQVAFDNRELDHSPFGVEAVSRGPIRLKGDDGSQAAEPMHRLDVDAEVWREVPNGADYCSGGSPGANAIRATGGRCSPSPRRRGSSWRLKPA